MGEEQKKRFTVSLPGETYSRLKALGERQNPPLSLQYMVNFAVNDLLERAEERQIPLNLGLHKEISQ